MTERKKGPLDLVWALLLIIAGTGVLLTITDKMEQITQNSSLAENAFFIRFSFYLMAVLLIGGGLLKIKKHLFGDGEKGEKEEDRKKKGQGEDS